MGQTRNPQAEQMASEAMVRTLAAQAEAIWPQELPLIHAYGQAADCRILDLACGTGEIAIRLAREFPEASIVGVDLESKSIARAQARARDAGVAARVEFKIGDAYALEFADESFDLCLCRSMLQAVPEPERVVAEAARVARPGGVLHLLTEDYGMMHFHPTRLDADRFWREGPATFAARTGTDLFSGRKFFKILFDLGLAQIDVDYIAVDTLRTPRALFAEIWRAWRDGYAAAIAANSELSRAEVDAHWEDMISCIESDDGFGLWMIPVWSARKPARARR